MAVISALLREFFAQAGTPGRAERKGARLLRANLTPAQLQQYEQHCYFDVIGGDTGHHYRIHHSYVMNVDELDANGARINRWCFFPEGNLAIGDIMLAQKIALELFETEALAIANRFPTAHLPRWRGRPIDRTAIMHRASAHSGSSSA